MTQHEFTSKIYEMLDQGKIEHEGKIYYSKESVLKTFEWIYNNAGEIVEVNAERIVENIIKKTSEMFTHNLPKGAKFEIDLENSILPRGCKLIKDENGNIRGVSI